MNENNARQDIQKGIDALIELSRRVSLQEQWLRQIAEKVGVKLEE